MKIVHIASELFPYVKTGGLADSVASQAKAMAGFGHDVSIILPGYRAILDHPDFAGARQVLEILVDLGDEEARGEIYELKLGNRVTLYLVRRDEFFDRRHPYGRGTRDYDDNAARFIFFDKAAVEALRLLELKADIVHCHDWQSGLVPVMLRAAEQRGGLRLALSTVLTIHNLAFQGLYRQRRFALTNLPEELFHTDAIEFYGQMSMLKAGLVFADHIATVSPTYAREIRTAAKGCGLDGVIRSRGEDLVGILNGVDMDVWNPATDKHLPANYDAADLSGKAECRHALLKACGFEAEFEGPVFGMVCRLAHQKGLDLVLGAMDFFARENVRLIVLGSGDPAYETALAGAAKAHPNRVFHSMAHDEPLSHLIEAGADFFLMPSIFEPCGLNQMYSMHYGTIPIVTRVGGLADTVTDIGRDPKGGTGIVVDPSLKGFLAGLGRAVKLHADKPAMRDIIIRGMARDFSWNRAGRAYEALYQGLV